MAVDRKDDKKVKGKSEQKKTAKPVDVEQGFAKVMEQVPYLVGLAETAHRSHPVSAFNKGGAASKATFQELQKELKEKKAPAEVEQKLEAEFKIGLQCANQLGQAVFINDQKEFKKQKAALEQSCNRALKDVKDAKGHMDEAAREEYEKKITNLNKKILEDELTKAQRIAKQEEEANFARAQVAMDRMKQEELDDFRAAHERWKPTGHPPPDPDADPKSQMSLVSGEKKLELKEDFYKKDTRFYEFSKGVDIRKGNDGKFYGMMRPAPSVWGFPVASTKRNYQNQHWELYKKLHPSGKKTPIILGAPGQPGPATVQGLHKAYNNGQNYEKTIFIQRRVEWLLDLAEKKEVRFEADAYLEFLKSRIDDKRPNNWRWFTAADYHALADRYKKHNERMAALEQQEKSKLEEVGKKKIQTDVVKRQEDKQQFLTNLEKPQSDQQNPGKEHNIRDNLTKEIQHVESALSGLKEREQKLETAKDANELNAARGELQRFCEEKNLIKDPHNADPRTLYDDYLLNREALAESKDIPQDLREKYDGLNSQVQVFLSPGIESRHADLVKDKQQALQAKMEQEKAEEEVKLSAGQRKQP